MAVTVGALTTATIDNASTTTTFSFTSTADPLYLRLGIYPYYPPYPVLGATYGGVALELVVATAVSNPGTDRALIFRLAAPTPGTANVVITFGGTPIIGVAAACNVSGLHADTPHGTTVGVSAQAGVGANTNGSLAVACGPGDAVIWVNSVPAAVPGRAFTHTATGGTSVQEDLLLGGNEVVGFYKAPGTVTAVNNTWTLAASGFATAVLVLKAAADVGPVWTASVSSATGGTIAFTVPGSAVPGQLMLAALYYQETGTTQLVINPVAGWTISAGTENAGSTPDAWLAYAWKRVEAADVGAGVSFVSNGSWHMGAMVGIANAVAGGDPFDGAPASTTTASTTTMTVPDVTPSSTPHLEVVLASVFVDTVDVATPSGMLEAVESGSTAIFYLRRTAIGAPGSRATSWSGATYALGTHLLIKEEPPSLPDGQLAAPTGDTALGTWTDQAGGTSSLYQRIDEAVADDGDFVRSQVSPVGLSPYEASLAVVADPELGTGHGVRVRGFVDVVGATAMALTTELRQGAAALSPPASWTDTLTGSPTTFTHALSQTQANAITDYAALRLRLTATEAANPAPQVLGVGTPQVATTAAITVAWPTSPAIAVGDIALLCVERAGGSATPTLSTPAGFVQVTGALQSTGTSTAGTKMTVFWCRATATSMASPVVAASADHQYGVIVTFRGCVGTGDPWNVVGGGVKAAASTSVSMTGVTTTVGNTLVVYACARDNDLNNGIFSNQANASLTTVQEVFDNGSLSGGGGGFSVNTGVLAAAGDSGTMTATVTSGINAWVTIALRPAPGSGARAQVTWAQLSVPGPPAPLRNVPATAALGYNSPYDDAVLATPGLTAYYQLDDTGTTAIDRVGGRHGTYEGGYSRVTGIVRGAGQSPYAHDFDGSSGGVRASLTQTGTADWTLECWAKPDTLAPATAGVMVSVGSDSGGYALVMSNNPSYGNGGSDLVMVINGWGWADSTYNFSSTTVAKHLAVKRTAGGNVRFYVDGVLQAGIGSAMGTTVPNTVTTIGFGDNAAGTQTEWRWFNGVVDDVAIYNVALDDATVLAHYNAGIADLPSGPASYDELARPVSIVAALTVPQQRARRREGGFSGYASAVMADHPVGYWRLDEAVGSYAYDSSGGVNTLMLFDVGTGEPAKSQPGATADGGTSMALDGTNYLSCWDDATPLSLPGDLCLEIWVYPTSYAGQRTLISKGQSDGSAVNTYELWLASSTGVPGFRQRTGSGNQTVSATTAPTVGVWSHVAVVKSGTTVTHYLNGSVNGTPGTISDVGVTVDDPKTVRFGVRDDNAFRFLGRLDEAAIYPQSLSAGQLGAHYAARTAGPPAGVAVAVAATVTVPTQFRRLTEAAVPVATIVVLVIELETITKAAQVETNRPVTITAGVAKTDGAVGAELAKALALTATLTVPTQARVLPEPNRPLAATAGLTAPVNRQTDAETGKSLAATAALTVPTEQKVFPEPARAVALTAAPAAPTQRLTGADPAPLAGLASLSVPTEHRTLPETARPVPLLATVTGADAFVGGSVTYDEPNRALAILAAVAVAAPPLLHESRPIGLLGVTSAPTQRQTMVEGARALVGTGGLTIPTQYRVLPEPARPVAVVVAPVVATQSVTGFDPNLAMAAFAAPFPPPGQGNKHNARELDKPVAILATVAVSVQVLVKGEPLRPVAITAAVTFSVQTHRRAEANRPVPLVATVTTPSSGKIWAPEEQAIDGEAIVVPVDRQVHHEPADPTPVMAWVIALPIETAEHLEPVGEIAVANVALAAEAVLRGPPQQSRPVADVVPAGRPPVINPLGFPADEIGVGYWSTQVGDVVNLYEVLDEGTADDGDYVRSGFRPDGDELELVFEAMDDAGVSLAGTHLLHFRYGKPAGIVGRIDLTVTVGGGETDVATRVFEDIPTGWTDGTVDLSPAEIAAFRAAGGFADPRVKLTADQVG